MRHALTSVLGSLGLAIFVAAMVVAVAGPPIAPVAGYTTVGRFLATVLGVAAFAFVPAVAAIVLAEARRVQGLPYWLAVGVVTALIGFIWLWAGSTEIFPLSAKLKAFADLLVAGLVAAWVYWYRAGRRSGRIAIALAKVGETPLGPELSATRCRLCTALALILGLIPLSLAGWSAIYGGPTELSNRLMAQGERDARTRLAQAGLQNLSVAFGDGVATVAGTAPSGMTANAAFAKAADVLAPFVGMPGIVARLENAISTDGETVPSRRP